MIKVNIHEAKTHLSRYLPRLMKGESIILCKRNIPIAEIRPLPQPRMKKRPVGLGAKEFQVPAAFFEPLPPEVLADFEGKAR